MSSGISTLLSALTKTTLFDEKCNFLRVVDLCVNGALSSKRQPERDHQRKNTPKKKKKKINPIMKIRNTQYPFSTI